MLQSIVLEELIVAQPVKFPTVYGTLKFLTIATPLYPL